MHFLTLRVVGRVLSMLFATTIIRALLVSLPLVAFAAQSVAPAPPVREGLILAAVAGNALISPSMPVTHASDWETTPIQRPVTRRPRVAVPSGSTFRVVVTAYSSTPDQTDASPFITASGTHVHDGTIASNFLPFGTHVTFPDYSGNKVYIVEDRMARRFSDRADIWFASRGAAYAFGKRTLTMVVIK